MVSYSEVIGEIIERRQVLELKGCEERLRRLDPRSSLMLVHLPVQFTSSQHPGVSGIESHSQTCDIDFQTCLRRRA